MIGYRLAVYGLALITALYGCSGITGVNAYVNKQYQDKPKPNAKLAIIPLTRLGPSLACSGKCPPLREVTDEFFEKSFDGFSGKVMTVPIASTRSFFEAHQDLLNKLLDIKYSYQDLSADPGLKTVLDSKKLLSLREELANADVLLVPARFDLIPKFAGTSGYSEFRLYDLASGSMIFSSSRNMNVNRSDEEGRGLMAAVLIGRAASDFDKLYLNK